MSYTQYRKGRSLASLPWPKMMFGERYSLRGTKKEAGVVTASFFALLKNRILLSFLYKIGHDRRIGKCRCIAKGVYLAACDLPQYPSHDLSAPGLGQARGELHLIGRRYRTDDRADMRHKLFLKLVGRLDTLFECNIYIYAFTFNVVRITNDCGLGNSPVSYQAPL